MAKKKRGGRPALPDELRRDKTETIFVNEEERQAITKAIEHLGVRRMTWEREVLLRAAKRAMRK